MGGLLVAPRVPPSAVVVSVAKVYTTLPMFGSTRAKNQHARPILWRRLYGLPHGLPPLGGCFAIQAHSPQRGRAALLHLEHKAGVRHSLAAKLSRSNPRLCDIIGNFLPETLEARHAEFIAQKKMSRNRKNLLTDPA